eukprot:gene7569-7880_t
MALVSYPAGTLSAGKGGGPASWKGGTPAEQLHGQHLVM